MGTLKAGGLATSLSRNPCSWRMGWSLGRRAKGEPEIRGIPPGFLGRGNMLPCAMPCVGLKLLLM